MTPALPGARLFRKVLLSPSTEAFAGLRPAALVPVRFRADQSDPEAIGRMRQGKPHQGDASFRGIITFDVLHS